MPSDAIAARFRPVPTVRTPRIPAALAIVAGLGALLLGIAGFSVSPKLGIVALGLPILPLFVLAPDKAVLLVVAAVPFDAIAGIVPGGTVTRLLGVAVMGGWVVHVMVRRRRVRTGIAGYLLFAFVAFAAASVMWAIAPSATAFRLRSLIQLVFLYVMLSNLLASDAAVRRVIDVWLASTAVMALIVIAQFPGAGDFERASLSAGGAHTDANFLAANLVLPVVMAVAIGGHGPFGWWRWLALVPIGVAAFITGSRGGILALGAGMAVLCLFRPRLGLRIASAGFAMVLAFGLVAPRSFIDKLVERFTNVGEDRMSGRLDIWNVGFEMIADHPLVGTGLAGFEPAFQEYMRRAEIDARWAQFQEQRAAAPHSLYIGTTAELGILGLAILLAAVAAHAFGLWKAVRRAVRWRVPPAVPLAMLGGLATLLMLGFNVDLILFKPTWLVLGLAQAAIVAFAPRPQPAARRTFAPVQPDARAHAVSARRAS